MHYCFPNSKHNSLPSIEYLAKATLLYETLYAHFSFYISKMDSGVMMTIFILATKPSTEDDII